MVSLHGSASFVEFRKEEIEGSIPRRFERQAALYPERIAVRAGGTDLTYRALDDAADRTARALLSQHGPAPDRVALLFDRDAGLITTALGVLKAGKVWVPLDVGYPRARNSHILEHSQAALLLTDAAHAALASELAGARTRVLTIEELASGATGAELRPVRAGALACLLYTSGSTGLPKGVVYNHRTLLQFIQRYTNALRIGPDDRLLQFVSFSHIAGVCDCLRGLLNGATVLPIDPRQHGPAEIAALIQDEEITICHVVPSLLRHIVNGMSGKETYPRLRLIHSGGDTLLPRDVELYKRHFPPTCILLNNLGCTEVSSFCHFLIDHDTEIGGDGVPVGYAVEDTEVLLLDQAGAEVPAGLVGEIAVKSRYLAVGYWREPTRTRRAFRPVPGEKGRRVYRTGDMGRRLPDGRLLHLGRKDFQVQIRGYRVEPGEIEQALLESHEVDSCAVVGLKDRLDEMQLAAYVVPAPRQVPTAHELRVLLRAKLPTYMVPAAFVWLDRLPLLPNGKLDRLALPTPDWAAPKRDHPFVAPRTAVEQALAAIWAEVLGVARVGIHDDFFDLGGNSLGATQVVARVQATLGTALPVGALYEAPVLAGLANRVEMGQRAAGMGEALPPLVRVPREAPAPLSYAQQRMWFFNQLEPESPLYHQIVGGLGGPSRPGAGRWIGRLDLTALERGLAELVRRHEVLRARFPLTDQGVVQDILPAGPFHLPVEDLTDLPAREREHVARRRAIAEIRRPFNLTQEPALRARVLRLAVEDHVVILTVHHVAFDRWSRWLLLRELTSLYSAFATDRPSPLSPLPLQYRDYAHWQRAHIETEATQRHLAYWRERLRGAPAVLELPGDRPRPERRTYGGATLSVPLPPRLTEQLEKRSRSEGATLPMALVAGFHAMLWRWAGQADLTVGMIVAGRTRVELETLIGCFTNTLILRTDLSDNPSFGEFLRQVRERLLEGYAHQELPFEKLLEELRPERSPRYHPLFQVLFNYLDVPRLEAAIPGVVIRDFEVSLGTALVDLAVNVERSAEGLTCYFTYSTDLFENATIARLAEQYLALLEAATADPERRLSALPVLPVGQPDDAESILQTLDQLSDEEAERLLAAELRNHTP